jgi:signal transduction histidine kinase
MLHEFVTLHRDAIIAKTQKKLNARPWPAASALDAENGVPLFLMQLSETLRYEATPTPFSAHAIGNSAAQHGQELLARGFTVSEVVHDYGDVCQAITELAVELRAAITAEEFQILNRCLDTAIAEAVTAHARMTAESRSTEEVERLGHVAHEVRDILNTALLAFQTLKTGTVAINGSTGAVLGRSLMGLRDFIDSTLSDVRMAANHQRRERVTVVSLLNDLATASGLHAEYRGLKFAVESVDPALAINADPQLLASAVSNLLNNAFKYTPAGGHVALRAYEKDGRLRIEVEDECGGMPETKGDPFQAFGDRRGVDRTGLGLGLAIARKAVKAHGGDIEHLNVAGHGCTFIIDVPLAGETVAVPV